MGTITYEWGMQSNSRVDVNVMYGYIHQPTLISGFQTYGSNQIRYPSKNIYRGSGKNLRIESFRNFFEISSPHLASRRSSGARGAGG